MKKLLFLAMMTAFWALSLRAQSSSHQPTVADAESRTPLPNASIFDNRGKYIGMSNSHGAIHCAAATDYPLTVRYMGFKECRIASPLADTVFMEENVAQLREVVVESRQKKMLHILAYQREYSTLSSFCDTVTMFREKMVDFMLPADERDSEKGWRYPRILNTRSYYRFTDDEGLDSVSDRCNHHFTWSDWIGLAPAAPLPGSLIRSATGTDTVFGKYSPSEVWMRSGDRLSLDINVLADTLCRKWVPGMAYFLHRDDIDFEQFRMRLNYDDISSDGLNVLGLTGYSYNIDSRGRGHDMFKFNRPEIPYYVTTYTEVYIIDKAYITMKEARKWEKRRFDMSALEIFEPEAAPALQPEVLALIDRVNGIDSDRVRRSLATDQRLKSTKAYHTNYGLGHRVFSLIKDLTGITEIRFRRHMNRSWSGFRDDQKERNRQFVEKYRSATGSDSITPLGAHDVDGGEDAAGNEHNGLERPAQD